MAGMGQSAEVVPRPTLGDWMVRNNRRRVPKVKPPIKSLLNKRLQRATGPGSYNEEQEMKALIVAGKNREAAAYYERCLAINYRAGKPEMRWGSLWYAVYQARKAAA